MKDKKNYEEQLAAIMNQLADSLLELSDDEILAEAREEGIDPLGEAEHTLRVLRQTSKAHRMKKLHEAQRTYEEQVARMTARQYKLPLSPAKRRQLLASVLAARPDMQSALFTAQHRDFKELPDADVESFLKQIKELGILDSLKLSEE